MKVLITGAGGMVGRNISENSFFKQQDLLLPRSSELNLLDSIAVDIYIQEHIPDLIIHCAGKVGGIQANMMDPVGFLVDNLEMGNNIVLSAKKHRVSKLINMGSSCMYPRNINYGLTEDLILTGELEPTNEGYAIAKITTARLCEYISKTDEDLDYITLIPCNLYGRYDKFSERISHMIPAVIKKIYEAKNNNHSDVEIWGDGTARREFMYSGELADFCEYAVNNFERLPALLNVGLGYDYTINEYYDNIAKVIGYEGNFFHNLDRPVGMNRKLVSTKKLEDFGWKSKLSLEEGIERTFKYYINQVLNE